MPNYYESSLTGAEIESVLTGAVVYNGTQSLTDVEKTIARGNIGALSESGTSASASKLETARTIRTNLARTTAASFDGTANVTPGVTGVLPIANGGTGAATAGNARASLGLGTAATANIDATMTVQGAVPDSKKVGDIFSVIFSSAIEDINQQSLWSQGGFSATTGAENNSPVRIRSYYISGRVYKLALDDDYDVAVLGFLNGVYEGEWTGEAFAKSGTWLNGLVDLSAIDPQYDIRISIRKHDDSNITPTEYSHIQLLSLPTDSGLDRENLPANSKTVGDALLSKLSRETVENTMPLMTMQFFPNWQIKHLINGDGTEATARGYCTSGKFEVSPGTIIKNESPDVDSDGHNFEFWVHEYANDTWIRRTRLYSGESYIIPDGTEKIALVAGYAYAEAVRITENILDSVFAARMSINSADWVLPKKRPLLVAFGASTTTGSVHHFSGVGNTKALYPFPQYIADKLQMDCVNLGVGTTGFIARSDDNRQNFMDRIYNNDATLQNADVVILMFGYGNDYTAGLPIGSFDDYYPYDEEGYHPTGSANVPTMLAKGATLMGCLNWCIKWINEHYPKAQLIPIFSAPSANKDRTWTFAEQTEGAGVAPYKLSFNDPYDSATGTEANIRIKQISEEIQKLKEAANIQIFDQFFEGCVFSPYQTYAQNDDGTYALFSTVGTESDPTTWEWNSHPNDDGYAYYSRWLAGKIGAIYGYRY